MIGQRCQWVFDRADDDILCDVAPATFFDGHRWLCEKHEWEEMNKMLEFDARKAEIAALIERERYFTRQTPERQALLLTLDIDKWNEKGI